MIVEAPAQPPPHRHLAPGLEGRIDELRKRRFRWRFFRVTFLLLYFGILLDIATTALGYMKSGSSYEQNPLGGFLINTTGWFGLAAVMTLLCLVCYVSFRTVYWKMALGWSAALNTFLLLIVAFRWLAVVTAIMYILES